MTNEQIFAKYEKMSEDDIIDKLHWFEDRAMYCGECNRRRKFFLLRARNVMQKILFEREIAGRR